MAERISIPIKYIGEVTENNLLPINHEVELFPIQNLASHVLENNRYFPNRPQEDKDAAIQALSLLGAYALSGFEGRMKSVRWKEILAELEILAEPLIEAGAEATSHATINGGIRDMVHILQEDAANMEELNNKKRGIKYCIIG